MKRSLILTLLLLLAYSQAWAATSLQYVLPGTSLLFADSAQAEDVTFTLANLGTGAGQYSARYDKGTGAQPADWEWRCHIQLTGTNVVTDVIEVYVAWSDGTNADGELGTTTASLATDKRKNLKLLGLLRVDQTTTNTTMTGSGRAYIPTRYFNLAVWNASSLSFRNDTSVHGCRMTPMPVQMQ